MIYKHNYSIQSLIIDSLITFIIQDSYSTANMYRVMVISKDNAFLDQANIYLTRINADMRVITLNDPSKINETLATSHDVDAFVCDHNPPKIDAFAIAMDRTKVQDYRPLILTTQEKNEDATLRAFNSRISYYIVRDKPVMNLFTEIASKIIVSVEGWRVNAEKELNERRLKALVRLAKMHNHTFNEILHYALEESVSLTGSQMGYVALYDKNTNKLTMNAWSQAGMKACKMDYKPIEYDLDKTGIWGEPIRLKQTITINDYNANNVPGKKGIPLGHAPLSRLMMVPIVHNGEVLGTAGVANKKEEYTASDQNQFVLLMEGLVGIHLERLLKTEASATEQRLRDILRSAPVGIIVLDNKLNIIECNDFARNIIDMTALNKLAGDALKIDNNVTKIIKEFSINFETIDSTKSTDISIGSEEEPISIHLIMSPTSDEKKIMNGFVVVIEDVTALKKTASRLEGILHHVNVLDQIIYKEMTKSITAIRNAIANININPASSMKLTTKGLDEIEDGINFSKQYRNVGILDSEWQNLSEVVSRAIWSSNIPKEVSVNLNIDGIRLLADSALQSVFSHLISNSLKHGGKVTRINISYKINRGNLTVFYSDDGVGIPNEQKERLSKNIITDTERFGTFIINSVISASNFTIKETGIPGKGATFEIYVPLTSYAIY